MRSSRRWLITFWSFRIMVALGLGNDRWWRWTGLVLRRGGRVYDNERLPQGAGRMDDAPFIAVLAGWIVTETGRAPLAGIRCDDAG